MASNKQAERLARACINPQAMTTTTNGAWVSILEGEEVIFMIEAGAWTDGTHTFSAEEATSAAGAGSQAVAAGNLIGTFPVVDGATDDDQVYLVGYKPRGDYSHVRIINTVTGSPSTGLVAGAHVELSKLRYAGAQDDSSLANLPA